MSDIGNSFVAGAVIGIAFVSLAAFALAWLGGVFSGRHRDYEEWRQSLCFTPRDRRVPPKGGSGTAPPKS